MKTIRQNVFETNSSSTHSITIMSKEDYDKWVTSDLLYDEDKEEFIEKSKLLAIILREEEDLESVDEAECFYSDNLSEYPQSYDDFIDRGNLEFDTTPFTSKSGDEIVIICKYGYDS